MRLSILLGFVVLLQGVLGQQRHAIVAPKAFRLGAVENVVLNLHGYQGATVEAYMHDLPGRQDIISPIAPMALTPAQTSNPIVLQFTVNSNDIVRYRERQKVEVVIQVTNSVRDFTGRTEVLVSRKAGYLFVRTDRPIYRPSENIRIQVAPLGQEMAPDTQLVTIIIKTPDGIGIKKRNLALPAENFVEMEYGISETPEFGKWFVEARYSAHGYQTTTSTEFMIQRYVLPTFNVKVELDHNYILTTDSEIAGTLKSQYSYGRPVDGTYFINMKLKKTSDAVPIEFYREPGTFFVTNSIIGGVEPINVPIQDLTDRLGEGVTLDNVAASGGSIIIEAAVNGQADGVLESTITHDIPIIVSPYEIGISRTSLYYTPGLAYQLRVDIVNKISRKGVANVPVTITVIETSGNKNINTVSGDLGFVDFQIDLRGSEKKTIRIATADSQLTAANQKQLEFKLSAYQSSSSSYLQISATHPVATVGQTNFQLTFSKNKPQVTKIRYFIISRGTVVHSGVNTANVGSVDSTELISVTQTMVPSARVVAYYLIESEVVSNSLWFDVQDQCKENLVVRVPDGDVVPGSEIEFNVEGPSNALVSVSGVDRAAYFLFNGSRLTNKDMFDKMGGYDQGCIRSGGSDTRNVFLNAGLVLSATGFSPSEVNSLECSNVNAGRRRKKRQANAEQERQAKLAAQLDKCRRDGVRISELGEDCRKRGLRVKDNYDQDFPGCWRAFLRACLLTDRQREIKKQTAPEEARNIGAHEEADASLARQRTDFQESLLFHTLRLDGNGRAQFFSQSRDSITTFEIDTISMQNATDGFCIDDTQEIRVFKKVFVQLYAPFSLKLREQASLRIAVFNYDDARVYENINIDINVDGAFCSHFTKNKWTRLAGGITIFPNDAGSFSFVVLPLSIPPGGTASLQIRVLDGRNVLDNIRKEILIEEPGEIKDTYESFPFDVGTEAGESSESSFNIELFFPENFVPETRHCQIFAYTNFMGPTIEVDPVSGEPNHIENLFREPYGCGEQNMLVSGPNTYALHYQVQSGKLSPTTQPAYGKAIERLEKGYARELMWRSDRTNPAKRAFAVWATERPSTWLNAFVDKVFSLAKAYATDIEIGPLCSSLEWLLEQQVAGSGHFKEDRPPYHREMKGAVGGPLTLTAYVLISLEESSSVCPALGGRITSAKQKAVEYLKKNKDQRTFTGRPYAVALLAYAVALNDPTSSFSTEISNRLLSLKQVTPDNRQIFWKGRPSGDISGTDLHDYWYRHRPQAVDVEATSYALLSLVTIAKRPGNTVTQETLDLTRKIVVWLVSKRNEGGAFVSTQDTVIGLQALAEYQIWINTVRPRRVPIAVDLTFGGANGSEWGASSHRIHLDEGNAQFKEVIDVPKSVVQGEVVPVTVSGTGEGLVSYRCNYRTVVQEERCYFAIEYRTTILNEARYLEDPDNILLKIKLTITVRVLEGSVAEASIINVGLMSGFEPIEATIAKQTIPELVDGVAQRYEITKQNVIYYLRRITKQSITISFDMNQVVPVAKPQPAQIKVYDYYEPEMYCATFYGLPDDVPNIRTSNCFGDDANSELCRCAEGGCMTCRSRKQQLEDTVCLSDNITSCTTCTGSDCVNLYDKACRSNYVYRVIVVSVTDEIAGKIFASFTVRVVEVLKFGDDTDVGLDSELSVTTRADCYLSCKDAELIDSARSNNVSGEFVDVGRELLMMGNIVEKFTGRDGMRKQQYSLGYNALMERYIPDNVCERARSIYFDNRKLRCSDESLDGKRRRNQQRKCDRSFTLWTSCQNQELLRLRLSNGCD